ncbi:hypothetical protein M011DRAFT_465365 [Sporormia fimetaria CBS 119925]|uniref:Peptidase S54 rhomboid domain-containing protein n=1 Tax=Sporormia fimetaria CBS 119925 TaxID=1340428 RepID=A0A6A6VGG9_9PLEO|nr:hypothetical protein M011DRAFT_465365 [Sporormia fimetaria CBS 119925]
MITSGFTNAPVTQFLVFATVITSLIVSLTDTRYYLPIVIPHIWRYGQYWRFLTWQLCYTNSTEVLFAALCFYNLRVIERLWGSRKFASFLLATLPYTTLLPPLLLAIVLRPLSLNRINYLPSGPTAIIAALFANYYAAIPYTYRYKLAAFAPSTSSPNQASGSADNTSDSLWARSITLTSKSTSYILPLQLAFSQFPGSLLAAAVGWAVGTAYRRDMLPYASAWRVPGWVVGEEKKKEFEGLRARLDAEREREGAGAGLASGILAGETGGDVRSRASAQRRTLGEMVSEQFQGRA